LRRTIEINMNGQKKSYSSIDDVPPEVRTIFDSIKQVADQEGRASQSAGCHQGKLVINSIETIHQASGNDFPTDEILTLLREGKKIDAVKLLRDRTGKGLAEAKAAVDAIDAMIGNKRQGSGCAGLIVLSAGAGVALLAML